MEDKKEVQYDKPTSQLDLEQRQAEGYVPPSQLVQAGEPGDTPFDNGGFIGVDPVYQNAANETERPLRQTEGPEAQVISDAGHDKNVAEFDDESPLPIVDEEDSTKSEAPAKPTPSPQTAKKTASSSSTSS